MRKPNRRKTRAVPHVFEPGPWSIRETAQGAHCSRASHEFRGPQDASPSSTAIRVHEYGHLAISPAKPPKGASPSVLACEDRRVNTYNCNVVRQHWYELHEWEEYHPIDFAPLSLLDTARVAVASTQFLSDLLPAIEAAHGTTAAMYLKSVVKPIIAQLSHPTALTKAEFRVTCRCAKQLDDAFAFEEEHKRLGKQEGTQMPDKKPGPMRNEPGEHRWLDPEITYPPLLYPYKPAKQWVRMASEFGVVPKLHHRRRIDGKVFQRKTRKFTGTLLVDASGSMRGYDLSALITEHRTAQVAGYGCTTCRAELRVLAKNGRIATEELDAGDICGQYNGCDLPALEWLVKQPGPHTWISDTRASYGGGNIMMAVAQRECLAFCLQHGIEVVIPNDDD